MKYFKFLLSATLLGAAFLNGCGGGSSPAGISGTVYLGGEPLSALPAAGVSSLNQMTRKSLMFSSNQQVPPSSLIIRCKSSLSEAQQRTAIHNLGFIIASRLKHIPDTYVIRPGQGNIDTAYQSAKTAAFVESVEYNYELIKLATTPNDPYYNRQWDMRVTKFNVAWDEYRGQNPVTVAVLDTGINVNSPEFQGRLAPVNDWYDFIDDDSDPSEPTSYSGLATHSHGTNVAGIIGARPNNSIGYAGAAWDEDRIKILPIRVLDSENSGTIATITDGIYWAVLHKANVINLSLGGPPYMRSTLLDHAIEYASSQNVTVVCAAGNYDYGPAIQYPALLAGTYANVIAVGATGFNNSRTYYSCIGPELTVMAPGGDDTSGPNGYIWNITFDKQSQTEKVDVGFAGTSQATPHVSALAALLYSYGITSPAKIKEIISQTATDLDPSGRDDENGYGLINAFAALTRATKTTITLVTVGLRNPLTLQDVITPVHPSGDGFYQIPNSPSGTFELYGTYTLTNGYKYEKKITLTINKSIRQDLVLKLIPSI